MNHLFFSHARLSAWQQACTCAITPLASHSPAWSRRDNPMVTQVFVWEDGDDDDVISEYRTFEGHREDITNMAACPERQVGSSTCTASTNAWDAFI